MTGAKFDIEKFDGTGDFGLWRIKMRGLLIQHGCEVALEFNPMIMEEISSENRGLNKKALTVRDFGLGHTTSKEIKERSKAKGDDGEGLYVRGRTDRRDSRQSRGKSRSKSRGCSYHMTPRLDILFDFLECDGGSVQLGDNRECKIRGGIYRNIASSHSSPTNQEINVPVILSGIRRDNCVYSLDGHAMAGELNASVEKKDTSCISARHTTHGVIDYVHSDLWGPSQVESDKELRGILNNCDDYSRRTGRTVKKLGTDNGLEFCNREFKQLCIESGIARHLTVVGTPQQNGLAERMNRTLMDKRQTRTNPLRFQDESNMAAYAFAAAKKEDTHEPLTYQEAVACEDSFKWKAAMEERWIL
ncbi:retrovirus-related pol polyprotein from transposon TNT 1-94 [Tanacetum coccineum]